MGPTIVQGHHQIFASDAETRIHWRILTITVQARLSSTSLVVSTSAAALALGLTSSLAKWKCGQTTSCHPGSSDFWCSQLQLASWITKRQSESTLVAKFSVSSINFFC